MPFHPGIGSRDQFLTCPFSIRNPLQIALRCSLCISYLHWINVTHWWRVFESMFINGFFKCLKIKSLTYWWSFQSCPGREKEPELERVLRSSWTAASRLKQQLEARGEEEEELFWEEDDTSHQWGVPFDYLSWSCYWGKFHLMQDKKQYGKPQNALQFYIKNCSISTSPTKSRRLILGMHRYRYQYQV